MSFNLQQAIIGAISGYIILFIIIILIISLVSFIFWKMLFHLPDLWRLARLSIVGAIAGFIFGGLKWQKKLKE